MNAYQGQYAQYYDIIYAHKPYADEVAFLERELGAQSSLRPYTWLDVACGSGSHALELARRGHTVTGLDYSPTQLARALAKLALRPEPERRRVSFVEGDMCAFDLEDRFDVVSCLFDSLGYAVTNERVLGALQHMRRHLAPEGRVVLEVWHAAAMLSGYEPKRVRRLLTPQGELVRTSETTLDVSSQTCEVKFTLTVPSKDTALELSETHVCRFFLLQELAAMLDCAGLALRRAYAGFDADAPIGLDTWHLVIFASAHE